jgi:hypothetical protein
MRASNQSFNYYFISHIDMIYHCPKGLERERKRERERERKVIRHVAAPGTRPDLLVSEQLMD